MDFQDGGRGGHPGFPIVNDFSYFFIYVTPMLSAEFLVKWPFGA